jgi:hypothetical protein
VVVGGRIIGRLLLKIQKVSGRCSKSERACANSSQRVLLLCEEFGIVV